MRNITKVVVASFLAGKPKSLGNTATTGKILTLHGNEIARKNPDGSIVATLAGWGTVTTRERLNGLCCQLGLGGMFSQRRGVQYFGDTPIGSTEQVVLVAPTGWQSVETSVAAAC